MAELPKSVIARMRSQAAPQEHPEADLLAAFVEQALTGRERENVLAHLAICTTCRETVALAAPEPVATQPAAVFVPWYRRPRLFAWAGTLATLAVMASLLVNYGKEQSTSRMVNDATPAKVAVVQPEENKPAGPPTKNEVAKGSLDRLDKAPAVKAESANAAPKQKTTKQEHGRDEMVAALPPSPKDQKKADGGTLQSQYSVMKEAAPEPAPPPPATAPAAVKAAGTVADKQVSVTAESVTVESAAPARSQNADLAANQSVVGGMAQRKAAKIAASAPAARWSISDQGKLQRSSDQGQNWQPILNTEPIVFRAVAVVGNDVWAGGSGGALFHSADGGATWTRQTLPGASKDLVSLQFTDAQHGTARTADGTAWSTSDGGQRWTKR